MGIAKNASRMSLAVMLSRVLGLGRELALAALFGAGMVTDAYLVAFRIPNLFRDLFAEGALSQAFVSVFAPLDSKKKQEEFFQKTQRVLSASLIVVCFILFFFAPHLVEILAEGFRDEAGKFGLTVGLTKLIIPFLYFVSFAALSMGVLNSLGVFFIPSLGSAAFNFVSIVLGGGLALYLRKNGIESAMWGWAGGTLVAGFAQWFIQWPSLKSRGFQPMKGLLGVFKPYAVIQTFKDPLIKKLVFIMAPAVLGVAAVQINVMVSTIYATSLEEGSVSWLSYAYRLLHFPMGVFGVALSTATLPTLTKVIKNRELFEKTLSHSLSLASILAIGAMGGLIALGEPIISWLFERGAFTSVDTAQTYRAVATYAIGLMGFIGIKIVVTAYYAHAKVWIPSIISLSVIGLNILGMEYFSKLYGHAGLSLSTGLVALVNLVLLIVVLKKKFKVDLFKADFMKSLLFSVLAASVVFVPTYVYLRPWLLELLDHSFFVKTLCVLGAVGISGTVYLLLISVLRPEGRAIINKFASKLKR